MGAYLATPAFAKRTSSRPFSRWIWANRRSRSPSFDTSPRTAVTLLPISLTAAASSGSRRPVMNTYAPAPTNSFAVARPIPLLPPVTSTILPSSFPMLLRLPSYEHLGLAESLTLAWVGMRVAEIRSLHDHRRLSLRLRSRCGGDSRSRRRGSGAPILTGWLRHAVCGPESGRQFVKPLPRSLGVPFPQPATPALDVLAQKVHPLVRRRLHGDVSRGRPALSCPAGAIESNGVAAIVAEAEHPGRATRALRSAVREVSHHRVHRPPGMNRLPPARGSQRVIHPPDEQRIEDRLERLTLGREVIPDLAPARDFAGDDPIGLESTQADTEPLRRYRRERSPQLAEPTRTGEQVTDDQ